MEQQLVDKLKKFLNSFISKQTFVSIDDLIKILQIVNNIKSITQFDLIQYQSINSSYIQENLFSEIICKHFFDKLNFEEQLLFLKNCDLNRFNKKNTNLLFFICNYNENYKVSEKTLTYLLQNSDLNYKNYYENDFFNFFHIKKITNGKPENSFLYNLSQDNFNLILDKYTPQMFGYHLIFESIVVFIEQKYLNISLETTKKLIDLVGEKNIGYSSNDAKKFYNNFLIEYEKNILNNAIIDCNSNKKGSNKI